jgi:dienelactone hydrolase
VVGRKSGDGPAKQSSDNGTYLQGIIMRRRLSLSLAMLLAAAPVSAQPGPPQLMVDASVDHGERPSVVLSGLAPRETVRVHYFLRIGIWGPDGSGGWRSRPTLLHGWGDYRADRRGRVDMATARPIAGTSRQVGAETLIWSAYQQGSAALAPAAAAQQGLPEIPAGTVIVRAERGGTRIAEGRFSINNDIPGTTVVEINTPGLTGVFAAPPGGSRLPTIIHLHGSEGGSIAKARAAAVEYAAQGFATLALAYFAWPYEAQGLSIPNAHRNIDVAQLDRARAWLAERGEADISRIALVGNSKGAEFSLVGAVTYPWVRAAVACVPSDIVWEGYGAVDWDSANRSIPAAGTYSSWSIAGQPLPYLPTFADRRDGWPDNTARYDEARATWPEAARWARIPVEQTSARLFLIGGGRDRTWASGTMTANIVATMRRAGRGGQVETFVSPTADHYLCGNGQWPVRTYQQDRTGPDAPDIDAQGAAEVAAHAAKIAFLRRVLR